MEAEPLSSNQGVTVSIFEQSVDNYFHVIDMISELCGEPLGDGLEEVDIRRLSSSVKFLREWKYFNYEPRVFRFGNETGSGLDKGGSRDISLPQFSSAAVPKEGLCGSTTGLESSEDFVMYVGGSVSALDWCPRVQERPACRTKCEFIAVAAHPPESYYHRLGAPLTGRGVIQIWCVLNVGVNEETRAPPKRRYNKASQGKEKKEDKIKKPRGRPRKKPIGDSSETLKENCAVTIPTGRAGAGNEPIGESNDGLDGSGEFVQALAVQYPEDTIELLALEGVAGSTQEDTVKKNHNKRQKKSEEETLPLSTYVKNSKKSKKLPSNESAEKSNNDKCPSLMTPNEDRGSFTADDRIDSSFAKDAAECNRSAAECNRSAAECNRSAAECNKSSGGVACDSVPKDIMLPRVVLCLAHNGKVAWDVKWQPSIVQDSKSIQRMGYLAVLLGNGSVEVWEVPLPRTMKTMYLSPLKEGTDPRFVKLEPVFRCSKLKCGGRPSIPLSVEWSPSHPHDFLLAGCHDGTVALWKFSASDSLTDTRPLLFFSADTAAIRSVAWAPVESSPENAKVIVTAGHGSLKFWDINDPFQPLWELHVAARYIYSMDWLPDPRCIILTFDDGAIRILNLVKAVYDVPATGKPFTGSKQQGLHLLHCSSFAVWSVQVSRLTGMAAYCCSDGNVFRFQLTKSAEKDPVRNRAPHFLCGSLSEDKSTISVNTPSVDIPVTWKKPAGEGEKSMRGLMMESNSNSSKASKDKKALCYDNNPESDSDLPLSYLTSRKEKKSKSSKGDNDQALVCINKETSDVQNTNKNDKGEATNGAEIMPPKMVSLHRVRWNMNKGSERWLCYGGAAGIVRCHEIMVQDLNRKSSHKR